MPTNEKQWDQSMLDEERDLIVMLDDAEKYPLEEKSPNASHLGKFVDMAREYYLTRKTVTFKPQQGVLQKFKERAEKEGIPYQALLNSVMKKYAEWSLVQKEEMYVVK